MFLKPKGNPCETTLGTRNKLKSQKQKFELFNTQLKGWSSIATCNETIFSFLQALNTVN